MSQPATRTKWILMIAFGLAGLILAAVLVLQVFGETIFYASLSMSERKLDRMQLKLTDAERKWESHAFTDYNIDVHYRCGHGLTVISRCR